MADEWTPKEARSWLNKHNYHPIKNVERKRNSLHYRMDDPSYYSEFRTMILPNGVHLVLGNE